MESLTAAVRWLLPTSLQPDEHGNGIASSLDHGVYGQSPRSPDGRPSINYFHALSRATGLPPELVTEILDLAEVWAISRMGAHEGPVLRVQNGRIPIASTQPLFFSHHARSALRRIVFRVTSKDQGWSSNARSQHGTFEGSYTWFDASVEPPSASSGAQDADHKVFEIQRNRHAGKQFETYCVTINPDHEIFQLLAPGCKVGIYACAHFPGWTNQVSQASIDFEFRDTFEQTSLPSLSTNEHTGSSLSQ